MSSHGTAGARRRLRWHSREHRGLVYGGRYSGIAGHPDVLVFRHDAEDGRTYELALTVADAGEVAKALRSAKRDGAGGETTA